MKSFLSVFGCVAAMLACLAPVCSAQSGETLPVFPGGILKTGAAPVNGTNEIQTLTFGGTPTGGTFKLRAGPSATAAVSWSATNATLVANIDAALEALGNIGTGGVTTAVGTMTAGIGTITVTFTGVNAKKNVAQMTVQTNALTGTAPTLAVTTSTPGVDADGRTAAKGQLLIDAATPDLYINEGTPPNPAWVKVSP